MKIIREILGRIFAFWAALVFAVTLLLIYIPVWLTGFWPEPKRTIRVFKIFNLWMDVFFFLSGVRRVITGKEHFKTGENFVIVCNHNSFFDVPLSSLGIPGANKTIAKFEMIRIPVFGMIYKRGSVLVNRKSEESRRQSYMKMKEVLGMGLHMCIYPEGTRNKTKEPLQRFHDGAFKLAVECGKSVIPTVLLYTKKVLPKKGFYFWPHHVEMHFLQPVPVVNKTTQQVRDEVYEIMKAFILKENKA
jgi:1-acyl-sn-glycerol-3-phosphate acyltransferase